MGMQRLPSCCWSFEFRKSATAMIIKIPSQLSDCRCCIAAADLRTFVKKHNLSMDMTGDVRKKDMNEA